MSSVKYDEVACDNVASNLKNVMTLLSEVNSDLTRLIDAIPSSDKIDNRIIRLSTKTRTLEDGTTENYIDYDTKRYYENNYKSPLLSAKTNLSVSVSNVKSLNTSVSTIDEKVVSIQGLIKEYEEEKVEQREISGLTGGGGGGTVVPVSPPSVVPDEPDKPLVKLNVDTDGDGKPDLNIDTNGDGIADLNIDTDGDGKPDVNIDTNGDGVADLNIDVDNDGKPDKNIDTNGDGVADLNVDKDGDGKPDLNIDLDGNGTADLNIDKDGDGKPDLNVDIDGDGKADLNIDTDGDGKADKNIDKDGDGVIDSTVKPNKGNDTESEDGDGATESTGKETNPPNSDLFKEDDADKSEDGFADNIVAGNTTPTGAEDGDGTSGSSNNGGAGGIWGTGGSGSGEDSKLFPFLPGNGDGANGDSSDLIYRGLYDQTDESFDMNQIKYSAIGEDGSVAKGAAVLGAVGLGASGVDAVATLNENRKQDGDTMTSSEEKEEKKLVKTIVSSSILGLVSIGYIIALLMSNSSVLALILLGVAMAISSITATSGLKIGKYIGFGAVLFVSLLAFVLSSLGVVSPIGYVVVFATFVILSIAAVLLDLLKGMFDDKLELVPIIIAIAVGLFFGMLKVLDIINWIILVILLLLTVGGYFLWDKVIKYKLPDDDDDDEIVDNVIYKPVQYTENSPMNAPQEEKFDPRSLYKEDDAKNEEALSNMMKQQDQNPFANYNPKNSTFNNAFMDDNNNNNNNNNNGMF